MIVRFVDLTDINARDLELTMYKVIHNGQTDRQRDRQIEEVCRISNYSLDKTTQSIMQL